MSVMPYELTMNALKSELAAEREARQEAERRIELAGGYHARTEREIEIEAALEEIPQADRDPHDNAIAELLELVDAGRNRLHEEMEARQRAEALNAKWLSEWAKELATSEAARLRAEASAARMRPFLEAELAEHRKIFERVAKQTLVPVDAEWRGNQISALLAALQDDTGKALAAFLERVKGMECKDRGLCDYMGEPKCLRCQAWEAMGWK